MKISKKFLSLCLALLMLLPLSSAVFAVETATQNYPVIHVPGINTGTIYTDVNDPSSAAKIPDKDTLLKVVEEKLIPAIITYTQDMNADALAHVIASEINILFADWFFEKNGDPKPNSGVIFDSTPSNVTEKSNLTFRYDWRCDPVAIADKLNAYINHVLSKSGCEKVGLTCHSLGSNIIVAYLSKYGTEKISALVLDTPACEGVTFAGAMLSGKSTLNSSALTYYLESIMGQAEYNGFIESVLELFNIAGVPELFSLFFDKILDDLSPVLYKETLIPLMGCWPSIWALSTDAYIDDAMAFVFDDLFADEDYSALREKIENYNKIVRENRDSVLRAADRAGNLAVISRYGYPSCPIADSGELIGDTVIETRSSSLGATTAPVKTFFDEKYLEGKDMKYISPDRTVDASTCLFPEKTWFIKNITHSEEITKKYYSMFLFAETELTCDSSTLGRFTLYDKEHEAFIHDTTEPVKAEKTSPIENLVTFIKNLIMRIGAFFKNFFKK